MSLSHRILPVIREYERTSTTVLNAYVQPTVASYLAALRPPARFDDDLRAAADHAVERRDHGRRGGRRATGVHRRIGAGGRGDRLGRAGATARDRRGHHLRHGRHDRQGLHRRARPAALHGGVRGRGGHLRQQPPVQRWRLRAVRAVHRPRRDRRRRREPHLARSGRGAARRSDVGRGRPGPRLLRQGRRRPTVTDVNLLLGYLNPAGLLDGAMPLDVERARAVFTAEVADRLQLDPRGGRLRLPRARQREHDPGDQVGDRSARPRPARLHARRVRWKRPDPRRRDRPRARHPARPRPAAAGRLLGRRAAPGSTRVPREADLPAADGAASTRTSWRSSSRASRPTRARASAPTRCATAPSRSSRGPRCATSARDSSCRSRCRPAGHVVRLARPARRCLRRGARADLRPPDRQPTEIVHLRVVAREVDPPPFPSGSVQATRSGGGGRRPAHFGDRFGTLDTPVIRRADLSGEPAIGPFVIEDYDATTVVPPDFSACRDGGWNIVIEEAR